MYLLEAGAQSTIGKLELIRDACWQYSIGTYSSAQLGNVQTYMSMPQHHMPKQIKLIGLCGGGAQRSRDEAAAFCHNTRRSKLKNTNDLQRKQMASLHLMSVPGTGGKCKPSGKHHEHARTIKLTFMQRTDSLNGRLALSLHSHHRHALKQACSAE